jgi:DNA integrity scanning protein DisA with diadenylate cyclase activity
MRHALTVLLKLSLLEDADWDLSRTRRVLDFAQVIDQVLVLNKELELQMIHNQNSIHDNMSTRVASQIVQLKERYVGRLAILEGRAASRQAIVNGSVQVNNAMLHGELFDGLDESFWQDIIADWNVFPNPV